MHKRMNNRLFLAIVLIVPICMLLIGYASISNINLVISGTANATGIKAAEDFKVKFNPNYEDGYIQQEGVVVEKEVENDRKANFTVTGLIGYGDTAVIKFAVVNESTYHSAILTSKDNIINDKPEYFSIERTVVDSNDHAITKINPGETAYYKIKVNVIKVPTDTSKTANVTVYLNAESEPYNGS